MPFIPKQYTDCAVYLYPSVDAANKRFRSGGSGFLIDVPSEQHPEVRYTYAVTNAHVIESNFTVVRLNTTNGKYDPIPLAAGDWLTPIPQKRKRKCDDIAIAFLGQLPEYYQTQTVPMERLITESMVSSDLIGMGDDVFMVGRFIGYDGKERNMPCVRFGNIAMLPGEPISQRPARNHDQESFMVEMRSISGFSGAPVFVYDNTAGLESEARLDAGFDNPVLSINPGGEHGKPFLFLLGVNWGHLQAKEFKVHSSMAGVVPGWQLRDLLYSEKAVMQRENKDKEIQRKEDEHGGAVLDYADAEVNNDSFTEEDFEEVLRKVSRPVKSRVDKGKAREEEFMNKLEKFSKPKRDQKVTD